MYVLLVRVLEQFLEIGALDLHEHEVFIFIFIRIHMRRIFPSCSNVGGVFGKYVNTSITSGEKSEYPTFDERSHMKDH